MDKKTQVNSIATFYYCMHNVESHLADFLLDIAQEMENFDDVDGLLRLREAYNDISAHKSELLGHLTQDLSNVDMARCAHRFNTIGQKLGDAIRSLREAHQITGAARMAQKVQVWNDLFPAEKINEWFAGPKDEARRNDAAAPHICLTDDSAPYVAM